ncbi:hypothetical protein BV22DRAFT_1197503 [Leucogyrophana mollusca]|uniref:Uncharacterized protein n=1 Tax=Leucogyrophana mollusca TaxID=85980 RepID=A0ACB8B968_9AGAM|nr:hypothetical protein BV22DRAFT_1197503 [Leucogyrophana mollusca]
MSYAPDEAPQQIILEKGWLDGTISTLQYMASTSLFTSRASDLYIGKRRGQITRGSSLHVPHSAKRAFKCIIRTFELGGRHLWRYMIIYRGCNVRTLVVMALPCLMFTASFFLGILFLIQWSESSPWGKLVGVDFTLPFLGMSLALNILSTIAIVLRLLHFRYRVTSAFGSGHGAQYTSIAGIIVESAAIYSTFSVIFLVTFAIGNSVSTLFLALLSSIQMFASLLIIWRITQGHAWSRDKSTGKTTSTSGSIRMFSLPSRHSRHTTINLSAPLPLQGIRVTKEVVKDQEVQRDNDSEFRDGDLERSSAVV